MSGSREPIPAAFWWQSAGETFDRVVREMLGRAQKAERAQTGHDCGHEWTITVACVGHSGIAGEGPESHADANYGSTYRPVVVRAHNLRDALLLAVAEPLASWFEDEES